MIEKQPDLSGQDFAAIGLGSNLGDREGQLLHAANEIDLLPGVEVRALSSLYQSEPWGDTDQPAFLNAVAIVTTSHPPHRLLELLREIEVRLGKRVVRKWGPRAIDLDLLLYGDESISEEIIYIPHPRIRERPFVYQPLREAVSKVDTPPTWNSFCEGLPSGINIESGTRRLEPRAIWPSWVVPCEHSVTTTNAEETSAIGEAIGRCALAGDIIALSGPLGAGKSCLARGIAHGLGISGPIQSPTFTFCREYDGPRGHFQHWDFYRLEGGGDLESTGFEDKMHEKSVFAIEWADLFEDEMPPDRTTWIRITRTDTGDDRRLSIRFAKRSLHLRTSMGTG